MAGRVENRVALVMGAGSVGDESLGWGNGKAASVVYAREGAKVFAVDLNGDAVTATQQIIHGENGTCETATADATDNADVKRVVEACMDRFGRIDILHNNVGGSRPGGPVELSEEEWDAAIDYNLKPAFLACKHVLPIMERQGRGVVINIASIAGLMATERVMTSYNTAKAGLIHFSRSIAIQYAKKGIRCNSVVPGLMNTPLVTQRITGQYGDNDPEVTIARRHAQCPTGAMGEGLDVAYAALFLASDEAKYVTATEIIVDGGLTAT